MRFFLSLLMLTCLAGPALAQEEGAASPPPESEEAPAPEPSLAEQRLALARQMHEIWPVRVRVEDALDIIGENIPEENRLAFKAQMRKNIQFDLLEQESIKAMADIFSVKELQKMVEFYGSPEGRAVSAKTDDYERALGPVMTKMMDKALLDTKLGTGQTP